MTAKPIALIKMHRGVPSIEEGETIKARLKKDLQEYCVVLVFDDDIDKPTAEIEIVR